MVVRMAVLYDLLAEPAGAAEPAEPIGRGRGLMAARLVQRPGPAASLVLRGARVLDPAAGIDEVRDLVVRDGRIGGSPDGPRGGRRRRPGGGPRLRRPPRPPAHAGPRGPGGHRHRQPAPRPPGGFVTIVAMPNTSPVVDTAAGARVAARARRARRRRCGSASSPRSPRGRRGAELTEQVELAERRRGRASATTATRSPTPASCAAPCSTSASPGCRWCCTRRTRRLSGAGVMHEGAVASRLGLGGHPLDLGERGRRARRGARRVRGRAHPHLPRLGGRDGRGDPPRQGARGAHHRRGHARTTWRSPTPRWSRSTRRATR